MKSSCVNKTLPESIIGSERSGYLIFAVRKGVLKTVENSIKMSIEVITRFGTNNIIKTTLTWT